MHFFSKKKDKKGGGYANAFKPSQGI